MLIGDGRKFANTYTRHQLVYRPDHGLLSYMIKQYQMTWNDTVGFPMEDRLGCTINSTCTAQQQFRKNELEVRISWSKTDSDTLSMITDYKVTSDIRTTIQANGSCDSESHSPLMTCIKSRIEDRERNYQKSKEYYRKKTAQAR